MATIDGKLLSSLRVVDLREELEKRGLDKNGLKKDLVKRLEEYMVQNKAEGSDNDSEEPEVVEETKPEESVPPSVKIDTKLEENDIVKEYMMMRQSQFQSAIQEVEENKDKTEEKEEAATNSTRSRRKRGQSHGNSESEEPVKTKEKPLPVKAEKVKIKRDSDVGDKKEEVQKTPKKPVEKSAEKVVDKASEKIDDKPKSPAKPSVKTPEKNKEKEPVEKTVEKTVQKSEKPVQKSPEKPAQKSPEKSVQKSSEKPVQKSPKKLVQKSPEKPLQKTPEKSIEKAVEKPVKNPKESDKVVSKKSEDKKESVSDKSKSPEKSIQKPVEKKLEKPVEEKTEKKAKESIKKPVEEKTEKKAKESVKKPVEKVVEKQAEIETKIDDSFKDDEAVDEILVSENVTFDEKDKDDEIPPTEEKSSPSETTESATEKREPVTFRKMLRLGSQNEDRKKRKWGDSKKVKTGIDTKAVSSSELKDIIPDIKPVLEEIKHEEEEKQQHHKKSADQLPAEEEVEKTCETVEKMDQNESIEEGPEKPSNITDEQKELPKPIVEDPAKIQEKLAPISEKNKNNSRIVEIQNLVRPFTNNQLINLLKRTGSFDEAPGQDFWIDKIKSHALVKYSTASEAEETVMALDGVKWPSSNQKKLIVTFTTNEHFERQSKEAVSLTRGPTASAFDSSDRGQKRNARENSEDNANRKRPRRDSNEIEDNHRKRKISASKDEQPPQAKREAKSLEVLFNKTKTLPSIYWKPKEEPLKADTETVS